jgi:SAM-dependent methyltransferase
MLVQGDLYHLSFPDRCFDAINFSEVIEHLETPDWALSELHRVLKPGGRIFLSTWPNVGNPVWRYRYARGAGSKEDFNPHTPSRVKAALVKANFRVTNFKLTNFLFTIPKIPWEISSLRQDNPLTRLLEKSLAAPVWGSMMAESINALAVKD